MKYNNNKLIMLVIIFTIIVSNGCSDKPNPYTGIQYSISIWTEKNATLYLPLLLDLPNYTVSDLAYELEVKEKSEGVQVSYDVINTTYGRALRVNTTGNVVLFAKNDYRYFEKRHESSVYLVYGQNDPIYVDLSLKIDPTDKLNFRRWSYLKIEDNSSYDVKVFETVVISNEPGYEGWLSLKDDSLYSYGNFTLRPGWQTIEFRHDIGYH